MKKMKFIITLVIALAIVVPGFVSGIIQLPTGDSVEHTVEQVDDVGLTALTELGSMVKRFYPAVDIGTDMAFFYGLIWVWSDESKHEYIRMFITLLKDYF